MLETKVTIGDGVLYPGQARRVAEGVDGEGRLRGY